MQRLTVYLKNMERNPKGLHNTRSHIVHSAEEASSMIGTYNEKNVSKTQISNLK